jgi:hypothetical protein
MLPYAFITLDIKRSAKTISRSFDIFIAKISLCNGSNTIHQSHTGSEPAFIAVS